MVGHRTFSDQIWKCLDNFGFWLDILSGQHLFLLFKYYKLGLKRIVVFGIRLFFSDNYRIFEYSLVCVMLIMCFIINTTKHDLITSIK